MRGERGSSAEGGGSLEIKGSEEVVGRGGRGAGGWSKGGVAEWRKGGFGGVGGRKVGEGCKERESER